MTVSRLTGRRIGPPAFLALLGLLAPALLSATLAGRDGLTPAETALAAGNRLVRDGRLEEALNVYISGYEGTGSPDPVLAYNLGTVAHHLDRLPEALLWYRRAEIGVRGADPALRADLSDNLELAHRSLESLGVQPGEPPAAWRLWIENRQHLPLLGIVLSWCALPLLALRPGIRGKVLVPLAVLSGLAAAAGTEPRLLLNAGPRPAVLLQPCPTTDTGLPAGSEVWVTPDGPGSWRVVRHDIRRDAGRELRCPGEAVGLVLP